MIICSQHSQFLAEELLEIKNNNIKKLTDTFDISLYEHYLNIYRGLTKS